MARSYSPASAAPPSAKSWAESIRRFREDREALQQLAADPGIELTARIPTRQRRLYLRELSSSRITPRIDVGELALVRRLLGSGTLEGGGQKDEEGTKEEGRRSKAKTKDDGVHATIYHIW